MSRVIIEPVNVLCSNHTKEHDFEVLPMSFSGKIMVSSVEIVIFCRRCGLLVKVDNASGG